MIGGPLPLDVTTMAERELARIQRRLDVVFLRLHLQREIRFISPLLVDSVEYERLELERLLLRFRPRTASLWPGQRMGGIAIPKGSWGNLLPLGPPTDLSVYQKDILFREAMSGRGVPVRMPSNPRGHLAICAQDDQLEVAFGANGVSIWSRGCEGFVLAGRTLPESVATAVEGLAIGEVVEHPALTGRDYPIVECQVTDPDEEGIATTTIRFETGRLPFTMPFVPSFRRLVRRRSNPASAG